LGALSEFLKIDRPTLLDIARMQDRINEVQDWITDITNQLTQNYWQARLDDELLLPFLRHQDIDDRVEEAFNEALAALAIFLGINRPTQIDIERMQDWLDEVEEWIGVITNTLTQTHWQARFEDEIKLPFLRHQGIDPAIENALDDVENAIDNAAHPATTRDINLIRWAIADAAALIAQVTNPVQRAEYERRLEEFRIDFARIHVNNAIQDHNRFDSNNLPSISQAVNLLLLVDSATAAVNLLNQPNSVDSSLVRTRFLLALTEIQRSVRWGTFNNMLYFNADNIQA
jgi:hypothetical protein